MTTPTQQVVKELETAFDFFNRRLFDSSLPRCMILLHRHRNVYGYFWPTRWENGKDKLHELSLNPDWLKDRPLKQVLSTLVHEQVHLWQQCFGKPPKNPGHNKEWADKMESIGLMPSSTGAPEGKRTGRKVSHYILDGGAFDTCCDELLDKGFQLSAVSWPADLKKKRTRTKRITYTCPDCELKVRGVPELHILCGNCEQVLS
jgi:predicted SprT family Zn-dependent metalloprotease